MNKEEDVVDLKKKLLLNQITIVLILIVYYKYIN
jgi:hypothetical protein